MATPSSRPAGLVHAITDNASTPFHNRTIELLQPTTNQKACTESCEIPVPCDSADKTKCATVTKLITADQWSVTQIDVASGSKVSAAHASGELSYHPAHRCGCHHEKSGPARDQRSTPRPVKSRGTIPWSTRSPIPAATPRRLLCSNSAAVLLERDRNPWGRSPKRHPSRTTITKGY